MEIDKRFDTLKQKVIAGFNDYLKTANDLYIAKRSNNGIDCSALENQLDKSWEEWQINVSDCNHFLVIDVKL